MRRRTPAHRPREVTSEPAELSVELQRVVATLEGLGVGAAADELRLRLAQRLMLSGGSVRGLSLLPHFASPEVATLDELSVLLGEIEGLDFTVSIHLAHTRVPFLGRLLDRLKAPFHRLSLYYVHRLAEHQLAYNERVRRLLRLLAAEVRGRGVDMAGDGPAPWGRG